MHGRILYPHFLHLDTCTKLEIYERFHALFFKLLFADHREPRLASKNDRNFYSVLTRVFIFLSARVTVTSTIPLGLTRLLGFDFAE